MQRKARKRKTSREDKAYMAAVAELRCCACRMRPCEEVHHCRGHEFGTGMGLKASDRDTIPLCRPCHDEYHRHGRDTWEQKYGRQKDLVAETQAQISS